MWVNATVILIFSLVASGLPTVCAAPVPSSGFSIDRSDRYEVLAAYQRYFRASEDFKDHVNFTGSVYACDEGTVSNTLLVDTLRRVNYYRAQAGLSADIVFDPTSNAKCQEAALIMAHQGQLSHYPDIDFPSNPCLTADGVEGAGNSNLTLGSYGPESIDRSVLDTNSNNAPVGHRRYLFESRATIFGHGSVPLVGAPQSNGTFANPNHNSSGSTWITGNLTSTELQQIVAWPNAGYVPYMIAPNSENAALPAGTWIRWSFSYPQADFSNASVTMREIDGSTIPVTLEPVMDGFGQNTIVWMPQFIDGTAPDAGSDRSYEVTVSGIGSAPFTSHTYDVHLMNPYDLQAQAVISGPATVAEASSTAFSFSSVPDVDGYELSIAKTSTAAWVEGAETSPDPNIVDETNASYSSITNGIAATGSNSFHLTFAIASDLEEVIEIDRNVIPYGSSRLEFSNRFRFLTSESQLVAEISTDGTFWEPLWTRNGDGNSGSGSSATWETSWQAVSLDIPKVYEGEAVRIRFRLHLDNGGSLFVGTSDNFGAFIDDVTITNTTILNEATLTSLDSTATNFQFSTATVGSSFVDGESYSVTVAPVVGDHAFSNQQSVDILISSSMPSITSVATLSGVQGQSVVYQITATNQPTSFGAANLPTGLTVNAQTGLVTGSVVPGTHQFTLTATNGNGTGSAMVTLEVVHAFDHWAQQWGKVIGGADADYDGDGLANLFEFAIGTDPTEATALLKPSISMAGGDFTATFAKSPSANGIDYNVVGSTNLNLPFSAGGLTVFESSTTISGSCPIAGEETYFMVLKVEMNFNP